MNLVRFGFPQMLALSVALHGALATGYVLCQSQRSVNTPDSSTDQKKMTLVLLASENVPDSPNPVPAGAHTKMPAASAPMTKTVMTSPSVAVKKVAAPPPPSVALEANPNAHVRDLPPEALLSPQPAPQLDGKKGVVFVLDVSGSMYEPFAGSTRLAFARAELARQIRALPDGAPFAITLYGEKALNSGPLVASSHATREAAVRFIMRDVDCGGGTNLPAGFASARELGSGRLVLVTDGDLNVTYTDLMPKAEEILGPKGHCPGLTVVGIAPRPQTEAVRLLQGLADQEGGTYVAEQVNSDTGLLTSAKPASKQETATP
ncbi:MAG: VWA domain-containing protein [Methylacidiphilales bacterium]|nr:VWA domain-containing protein [Candidatus Methylacidiphilales bacterium]